MDITSRIVASRSGGTARLDGGELPNYGYFVGGIISPLIVGEDTLLPVTEIDNFVDYVRSPHVEAEYLGWWTDTETGKLYVDATSWVADVDKAVRLGEERGEIAIFDIESRSSLYLDE